MKAVQNVLVSISPKLNKTNSFEVEKKGRDKTLTKLQNKAKEKIEKTRFSSTAEQQSVLLAQRRAGSGIVSAGASSVVGCACHITSCPKTSAATSTQTEKSKFDIFSQYVHFWSLTTSFLRGPPLEMV